MLYAWDGTSKDLPLTVFALTFHLERNKISVEIDRGWYRIKMASLYCRPWAEPALIWIHSWCDAFQWTTVVPPRGACNPQPGTDDKSRMVVASRWWMGSKQLREWRAPKAHKRDCKLGAYKSFPSVYRSYFFFFFTCLSCVGVWTWHFLVVLVQLAKWVSVKASLECVLEPRTSALILGLGTTECERAVAIATGD